LYDDEIDGIREPEIDLKLYGFALCTIYLYRFRYMENETKFGISYSDHAGPITCNDWCGHCEDGHNSQNEKESSNHSHNGAPC